MLGRKNVACSTTETTIFKIYFLSMNGNSEIFCWLGLNLNWSPLWPQAHFWAVANKNNNFPSTRLGSFPVQVIPVSEPKSPFRAAQRAKSSWERWTPNPKESKLRIGAPPSRNSATADFGKQPFFSYPKGCIPVPLIVQDFVRLSVRVYLCL